MILALTPGDPDGIGAEITWKAIRAGRCEKEGVHLLCIGARAPFEKLGVPIIECPPEDFARATRSAGRAGHANNPFRPPKARKGKPFVWLLPAPEKTPRAGLHLPGYQSGWSVSTATRLVQSGAASALVTGPISKERLQKGGFPFGGHTELLAHLCFARSLKVPTKEATKEPTMMLANSLLRVSLVTTHLALKDVPRKLTRQNIRRAVLHTEQALRDWWKLSRPRIAIAALNPHAGENGIFGQEEIRLLAPEIAALRKRLPRSFISDPLPADTLFAKQITAPPRERYDAVVCMYHDQGLIPVKLLDFARTVNITLGLPIIRTSVDHGVGFDIAGRGKADPSSLQSAIELATQICRKR